MLAKAHRDERLERQPSVVDGGGLTPTQQLAEPPPSGMTAETRDDVAAVQLLEELYNNVVHSSVRATGSLRRFDTIVPSLRVADTICNSHTEGRMACSHRINIIAVAHRRSAYRAR